MGGPSSIPILGCLNGCVIISFIDERVSPTSGEQISDCSCGVGVDGMSVAVGAGVVVGGSVGVSATCSLTGSCTCEGAPQATNDISKKQDVRKR